MDESKYLSGEEYFTIVEELCAYGLEELRLTGGEPLLRKSFSEITTKLASLPLKKIGLTTNGIFLDKHLEELKRNRIHYLNISLDSLDEATFQKITFGKSHQRILRNIDLARDLGFKIKINVVAMKGINDHEFINFAEYSQKNGIEVRFLEMMRIGYACANQKDQFISAAQIKDILGARYTFSSLGADKDSTSFNYKLSNGAQIGFIASESQAFCGQCSRWRLSADGIMRACLMKDDGHSVKNKSALERDAVYHSLLGMKPFMRPLEVTHMMNAIGG